MLEHKVAVVTGGSRGIGAATALLLAEKGADVAIIYAGNTEAAQSVADSCASFGVRAGIWKCDVADAEAVKATVSDVKLKLGSVDILVNNAGITRDGLVISMKQDTFESVLQTNLTGAFNLIRYVSPIMLRSHWGRIINVSSVAGLTGNVGQANYAASKAGLVGLTKSVARELALKGITCNAVAPGFIQTDMTKDIAEDKGMMATIPVGHMGKPEDVARAVIFLIESDYITGEVLRIDGGLAM